MQVLGFSLYDCVDRDVGSPTFRRVFINPEFLLKFPSIKDEKNLAFLKKVHSKVRWYGFRKTRMYGTSLSVAISDSI